MGNNNNLFDFDNNNFQNNNQFNQPIPQINNIFVINSNPHQNLLEGFDSNNNSNNNLLDLNSMNSNDKKSQDLLSNIQNAYNNPTPNESKNDDSIISKYIFKLLLGQ